MTKSTRWVTKCKFYLSASQRSVALWHSAVIHGCNFAAFPTEQSCANGSLQKQRPFEVALTLLAPLIALGEKEILGRLNAQLMIKHVCLCECGRSGCAGHSQRKKQ